MLKPLIVSCLLLMAALTSNHCLADIYVVASRGLPVDQLSDTQVRKLFLGRLRMLPGSGVEPEVFDLPPEHPLFAPFYTHISGMTMQKIKRYRSYYLFSGKGKVPTELDSVDQVIAALASQNDGVGYINQAINNDNIKILYHIKTSNSTPPVEND